MYSENVGREAGSIIEWYNLFYNITLNIQVCLCKYINLKSFNIYDQIKTYKSNQEDLFSTMIFGNQSNDKPW